MAKEKTRKVFLRAENENQTSIRFSVNGIPYDIPVETEVEVPEQYAHLVDNYKDAKKYEIDYRKKQEAIARKAGGLR